MGRIRVIKNTARNSQKRAVMVRGRTLAGSVRASPQPSRLTSHSCRPTSAGWPVASRLETSLAILVRLNEARRIGQGEAALLLNEQLEAHDEACGYSRPIRVERQVEQPGKRYGRNAKAVRP